MHPTLLLVEVLLETFAYLKPSGSASEKSLSRRSLSALARTCKPFYEPAMDLLWEDMDDYGIIPLLGCVTRLYPLVYAYGCKGFFYSDDPLSEHEGRQFLRHAARVRSLCIQSDEHFHLLTGLPIAKTCVFPRLLALRLVMRICLGQNANHWHLFLSPVLRRCELPGFYSDLKSIGTLCPGLESLSLGSVAVHATDELPYKLLSETVRSCKQLKHLQCTRLDCASWKHLSNLPTLVTVTIDEGFDDVQLDPHNVNFAPFLNITCLYFRMNTAAYAITIMQHSKFPSLKVLGLNFVATLPVADAEQLVHALSKCKTSQTLEYMEINSIYRSEAPESLLPKAIRHLFCFTQLRTLHLYFPIYLDDHILFEAMSSWPHIHSLALANIHFLITFRGVFAALHLCPHLHNLALHIDTVHIDIDPEAETDTLQHTSLQTLDVGTSHAGDPEAVARTIFSMLPCISRVCQGELEWDEVNSQLESLRFSTVNV
ncbi:hypothetical protein K503DRAFT_866783 [Rhizopogon vinicolor AM-OR11-026]|uniref:F-box domain-containing protein n=1 Tax=Rhizopogon vinicolor AM-OR11-026 TaxID=1314800 RepID=A0A1B7MY77_9AGAM|nr:hypothetical protein K503DRAFT_866783 [Rhizopogon vinicolor AM-OR11-026]